MHWSPAFTRSQLHTSVEPSIKNELAFYYFILNNCKANQDTLILNGLAPLLGSVVTLYRPACQ